MRSFRVTFALASLPALLHTAPGAAADLSGHVSPQAILRELNLARQQPAFYATLLEQQRSEFSRDKAQLGAFHEAVQFLKHAQPRPALALSVGLSEAAADHCREQAGGAMGHSGAGGSNPATRISRYGAWHGSWAENIGYGQNSARDLVIALIVDVGVRDRGHRRNIFNATFTTAGAAFGSHARFGTVCSIDFAAAYVQNAVASTQRQPASAF